MTTIRFCREIDISKMTFGDFVDWLEYHNAMDGSLYLNSESLPCYMAWLQGAEEIPPEWIPHMIEKALIEIAGGQESRSQGHESLLMVSVTSNEPTHGDWLDIARDYPGAVITTIDRKNRYVYNILFPGTPAL